MPTRRDLSPSPNLNRLFQGSERTRRGARAAALYAREQRESYRRLVGSGTPANQLEGR